MRKLIVLFVVLLVMASGCLEPPKDPKELFKELVARGKSLPNGKLSYEVSLGAESGDFGGAYGMGDIKIDMDFFSLNGNRKTLISMSAMGQSTVAAVYEVDGTITTCTESGYSSGRVSCQTGNGQSAAMMLGLFTGQMFSGSVEEAIEDIEISLDGEKNFGGRQCYAFSTVLESDQFEKGMKAYIEKSGGSYSTFSSSTLPKGSKLNYNACLDKQYGFIVKSNSEFVQFSELANKETKVMTIALELDSFDPSGASEADFKIPENSSGSGYSGNMVCNSSDPAKIIVKASSLESSGEKGSGESLGTIKITNLTGGDVSEVACSGSGAFAAFVPGCVDSAESGATLDLTPTPGSVGTHSSSSIDIAYTDYAGLSRTAAITCSGPIEIS